MWSINPTLCPFEIKNKKWHEIPDFYYTPFSVFYLSKPFRVFNIVTLLLTTTSGTTKINQYYRSRMTVTQPNDRKFGENEGEYKKNVFLNSAISEKKMIFTK